jgi:hypothetical protein
MKWPQEIFVVMDRAEEARIESGQSVALIAFATAEEASRQSYASGGHVIRLRTRGAEVTVGQHVPEKYVLVPPSPESLESQEDPDPSPRDVVVTLDDVPEF